MEETKKVDSYLCLIRIKKIKDTKDIYLICDIGGCCWDFRFVLSDWQLGYDLFVRLKTVYKDIFEMKLKKEIDEAKLLDSYIHLAQKIEKWKERKAPKGIRLTPSTLCNACKHRIDYNTCKAFPEGIPKELHNQLHYEKHPSQKNDIVFELGEEGSKNAGIKPLKELEVPHCSITASYVEFRKNVRYEIEEEEFGIVKKIYDKEYKRYIYDEEE